MRAAEHIFMTNIIYILLLGTVLILNTVKAQSNTELGYKVYDYIKFFVFKGIDLLLKFLTFLNFTIIMKKRQRGVLSV